jgi:hypothetical protein
MLIRTCTKAKVLRATAWRPMMAIQVSIWFSQLEPVGAEWKWTFRLACSPAQTSGAV